MMKRNNIRPVRAFLTLLSMVFITSCGTVDYAQLTGGFSRPARLTDEDMAVFREAVDSGLGLRPRKVARQVVAGTNYRFECRNKDRRSVEVVIFEPLPGRGDARVTHIDGKEVEPPAFRFIVYYEDGAALENLLKTAKDRGDEILYEYQNFKAIAISVTSCSTKERAEKAYSELPGVLHVIEDGIVNLD